MSETLTEEDLQRLRPLLKQRAREHGTLRLLFWMDEWHGWDSLSAMWEDLKTDAALNNQVDRLAMVGGAEWERWITKLTEPFAHGAIRYFDASDLDAAWDWLTSGVEQPV